MEFLKKILNRIKIFRKTESSSYQPLTREEKLRRCLQPYQRCLYKIQEVILWRNLSQSLTTLIAINIIFWYISLYECRFYCILFSLALVLISHEAWNQHIWPEIRVKPTEQEMTHGSEEDLLQERNLGEPEINLYLSHFCIAMAEQTTRMKTLRETQPLIFCGVMCTCFLILAGVGRLVSGLCLVYLLAMSTLLLPGLYIHVIPPEIKQKMGIFFETFQSLLKPPESSVDVDEYLPETSRENMEVFAEAVDFNTDTNGNTSEKLAH